MISGMNMQMNVMNGCCAHALHDGGCVNANAAPSIVTSTLRNTKP